MPELRQFEIIWAEACARYQDAVDVNPADTTFPHPATIEELQRTVEERNNDFTAFREKRGKLFHVLAGVCTPIEVLGKVGADAAAGAFPPSSTCFGAISCLIQAARNVSSSYDAIIKLFERLKDYMVRLQIYDQVEITPALRQNLAEILSLLLQVLAHATRLLKHRTRGRFEQYAKSILLGHDPELDTLLAKLDQVTAAEHHVADAETYVEVKKIAAELHQTRPQLTELATKLEKIDSGGDQTNERLRNIQVSLSGLQKLRLEGGEDTERARIVLRPSEHPADIFDQIRSSRVKGTGDWIQREGAFREWLQQTSPLLWVSGAPGSGKSYLCGYLISELMDNPLQANDRPPPAVAFFFFKDSAPATRNFSQALNDMAYQIAQSNSRYAKHLAKSLLSPSDLPSLRSQWRKLFVEYFVSDQKIKCSAMLVLDGIDEADPNQRVEFFEMLGDLRRNARLGVVMLGRPQILEEIRDRFEGAIPTIHIDESKTGGDIDLYIQTRLKRRRGLRPQTRDTIVQTLKEKAQGMFIWADLMVREIMAVKHESRILEALQRAPKGLDEMISHVLESFSAELDPDSATDLNIMLKWVTCAVLPLTIADLESLLQIESEIPGERIDFEERLRVDFASFFLLRREDGLTTADLQHKTRRPSAAALDELEDEGVDLVCDSNFHTTHVSFQHASIGEFFRSTDLRPLAAGDFIEIGVDFPRAQGQVLLQSLSLVCDKNSRHQVRQHSLNNWFGQLKQVLPHLRTIDPSEKREIGQLLVKLLRDESSIGEAWLAIIEGSEKYDFLNADVASVIVQWLQDADVQKDLSDEGCDWVEDVIRHQERVFYPAARVAARKWLSGGLVPAEDWIPDRAMRIVHCIISLDVNHASPADESWSVESIIQAAMWAGLKSDALWHRQLAVCLRDHKYFDEAMDHFETALKMDKNMWMARSGIARLYAMRGEYHQAVLLELQNDAILRSRITEGGQSDRARVELGILQYRIAGWYRALRVHTKAFAFYDQAFILNPRDYGSFTLSLSMLRYSVERATFDKEVITRVEALDDMVEGKDYTRLSELIREFYGFDRMYFWELSSAAKSHGRLPWLLEKYEEALAATEQERLSLKALHIEICCAELHYMLGDDEAAASIWQRIAETTSRPAALEHAEVNRAKLRVAFRYGQHLLQVAHDAKDPAEYLLQLKGLCELPAHAPGEAIIANYAALYLAIWYRSRGDEATGRKYARPFILACLDLLSDNDPNNDFDAYRELVSALLAAGDEASAVGVARFIRPQHRSIAMYRTGTVWGRITAEDEKLKIDSPIPVAALSRQNTFLDAAGESPVTRRARADAALLDRANRRYPISDYRCAWICYGECRELYPLFHRANICRICLTELCDPCLGRLKAGEALLRRRCRSSHDWLHVTNADWEFETGSGKITVGEESFDFDVFKERLREQWAR